LYSLIQLSRPKSKYPTPHRSKEFIPISKNETMSIQAHSESQARQEAIFNSEREGSLSENFKEGITISGKHSKNNMKSNYFTQSIKKFLVIAFLFVVSIVNGQTKLVHFGEYDSFSTTFPLAQPTSNFNTSLVSSASLNYGGSGITTNTIADTRGIWRITNSSTTLNTSTAPFLEYTVNFNGNANIDFDRFVITGGANTGSAATKFELRWSVDNYGTNLGFFTLPNGSYTLTSVNLSSLNNFTGNQIKFRVYIYNTLSSAFSFFNVPNTNGTLAPDGTPVSYNTISGAVASLWYFQPMLTVTSAGETGISGTNWSISSSGGNSTLTVTGNASINASVLETALASGNLNIVGNNLQVTVNQDIAVNSGTGNLTFGSGTSSGPIVINNPITLSGGFVAYGGNITVNGNINTSAGTANGDILLKGTGNITQNASKTITTAGGDVIFWSDADASGSGAITLGNNATINTANGATTSGLAGGGNIVLAGGADDGSNGGLASDGIPDGFAMNATGNGIKLGTTTANTTSLYSGGGNIILLGRSTLAGGTDVDRIGLYQFGKLIANSGKGAIDIRGTATGFYGISFVVPLSNVDSGDKNLVLISDKASGDAIKITGVSTNNIGVIFSSFNPKEILATGGGNISITGTAGSGYGVSLSNQDILASSGSITIDGGTRGIIIQNRGARFGSRAGTGITSSTANISLIGDVLTYIPVAGSGFTNEVNTTGSLTLQPGGTSFTSTLSFPGILNIANTVSGLTLGKSTNTQNISISAATTIPGPITIFGGAVQVVAPLTATNNTISITSATSLIDGPSGFLVANNLSLNGAGTVTIDQANNDVNTLAAGSSGARLGALSFLDRKSVV
jgi:hypothetical protein